MAAPLDVDSFTAFSDALQAAALSTTRIAVASLPADLAFHRSVDPVLARDINVFSDRVLSLASKLVHVASSKTNRIQEEEDVVDEFIRNIVDPMEGMLESTDGALDVFLGKRKDPAIPIPAVSAHPPRKNAKNQPFRGRLDPTLTHASHIPKPQLSFKHTPSNTDESPYIPATLIPHKWCARVPLGYVFHDDGPSKGMEDVLEDDDEEEGRKRTLHPYYYELTHPSYPDHVFNPPSSPSLPPPLDSPSSKNSHSLTFISTPTDLLSMANTITSSTELAIDLEHHSYRSWRGFLALMQISTRQGDFIVDLLVPEVREGLRQAKDKHIGESGGARMANEAGQIIARIFADPSVIKVFHGAESDIVWLQQDFNIFVVGLFDTFHASKLLEFPKHSLANLLETYCDFIPDKRYQLADWRIRPLPAEMLSYARSDTHFLLYIYDMLRLSLIERASVTPATSDENHNLGDVKQTHDGRDLILSVLTSSSRTALRLDETEVYDADSGTGSSGWDTLAKKWNKAALVGTPLQTRGTEDQRPQAAVYRAVHRWREEKAREEDESTRYVMPTHHLFLLAERAPTTIPDLLSLFGGLGGVNGNVPPVLRRRIGELVAVIKGAMEATKPRSSLQGSTEVVVASAVVSESETMVPPTPSSSAAKLTNESRLWAVTPSSTSAATFSISHSSLFGVGTLGEGIGLPSSVGRKEAYSAIGCVSFGSALFKTTSTSTFSVAKSTFTHAQTSNESAKHFEDIVEKIHKTLVISPVSPMPLLHSNDPRDGMRQSDTAAPEVSDAIPPGPEGQIEIPFVPPHKRQIFSDPQNEPKDDTIIVVGRAGARQRKRKREKAKGIAPTSQSNFASRLGGTESPASTSDYDREMEEFDYSRVPNLLDTESKPDARGLHDEDGRKRKKQRHGKEFTSSSPWHESRPPTQAFVPGSLEDERSGLFEYGDFRAPPRDQREVRSGNKTHTFR